MATVTSGSMGWTGLPSTTGVSQRRGGVSTTGAVTPAASAQTGPAAAYGITPEQIAARQPQTGVSPGGTGYVSGQAQPVGQALAALGTPRSTAPTGGQVANTVGTAIDAAGAGYQPGQTTNAVNSAIGAAGGTTTVQSGLGLSSPAASGQPGTSNTNTGTYTDPALATTGNSGLDRVLDPGGIFTGAVKTDTGPAVASQRAAFGLSDNLDAERYNYRPGAAAAQDRVQLDTTLADQTRLGQTDALGRLRDAATGNVPSAAELMMRREAGKNVAATLGQARALGARSAGGAARAGTLASADILARNTADSAVLRAGEQERARAAEIAALGGVRGQDQDQAAKNAGLAQEANANNLRSQLEQNELAEKHRLTLLDEQLKALGIGAGAAGSILNAGAANAAAENKKNAGILDTVGNAFG